MELADIEAMTEDKLIELVITATQEASHGRTKKLDDVNIAAYGGFPDFTEAQKRL